MDIPQVISKDASTIGSMGQHYLVCGKDIALRRWEQGVCEYSRETTRDYETVGYVLSGVIELDLDGQPVKLRAGDSWLVPQGAAHRYRVLEPMIAIEATSPPARFNQRDEPA